MVILKLGTTEVVTVYLEMLLCSLRGAVAVYLHLVCKIRCPENKFSVLSACCGVAWKEVAHAPPH